LARFKDAEPILAAAERWKNRSLLGGRSLFTDRSLWTRSNFLELHSVYVENLDDVSRDSFLVKLERQLQPASADAKCLWAEMTWVYHLIRSPGSMGAESKRRRIAHIWKWSKRDFPEDHELLSDAVVGAGVVNPGPAYNTLEWKELRFFAVAMLEWSGAALGDREKLLDHSWDFATWLDGTEFAPNRMFRHVLLWLLFPDEFQDVVSSDGKKTIVNGLHEGDPIDTSNPVEIDRALLVIRRRLEDKHGPFRFYDPAIVELWKRPPATKRKKNGGGARNDGGNEDPEAIDIIAEACKDLFVPRRDFERFLHLMKTRRNLILQGPPGTGKTFMARRIAWCLIERKDSAPIEMVQFHQSYAYEDFVQGYRPTESGGFKLRDGVFHRFCERARRDPKTPHVFIIDEINRGNLSRIFGELLMLIEADKRSKEYAVSLTYANPSGERFHIPDNVYILGMMNTADRSLAMVDYALRRRFAFATLDPAYDTEHGKKAFRSYVERQGVAGELVTRIIERMAELNQEIANDPELGRGYRVGHSYFVPNDEEDSRDETWYETVVDTQIQPLLTEYWFDSPERIDSALDRLKESSKPNDDG